jgi:hypothetical protein
MMLGTAMPAPADAGLNLDSKGYDTVSNHIYTEKIFLAVLRGSKWHINVCLHCFTNSIKYNIHSLYKNCALIFINFLCIKDNYMLLVDGLPNTLHFQVPTKFHMCKL